MKEWIPRLQYPRWQPLQLGHAFVRNCWLVRENRVNAFTGPVVIALSLVTIMGARLTYPYGEQHPRTHLDIIFRGVIGRRSDYFRLARQNEAARAADAAAWMRLAAVVLTIR